MDQLIDYYLVGFISVSLVFERLNSLCVVLFKNIMRTSF